MLIIPVFFAVVVVVCQAGVVSQQHEYQNNDATSYQEVNIKSYHPVPVYIKKEHSQLLEHPVLNGEISSTLKVHHGGKHDLGYAHQNIQQLQHYQQQQEIYQQEGAGNGGDLHENIYQTQEAAGYENTQDDDSQLHQSY